MNSLFKKTALALAMVSTFGAGPALASEVSTKGGIKVKSDDGQFVGEFGGRMHADAYAFDNDGNIENENGTTFRRLRLEGKGTMYGVWEGKIQMDFGSSASDTGSASTSVKDAYLAYSALGPGKLYLGQVKTPMSLEELTSSNYITFIERSSIVSAVAPNHKRGIQYAGATGNITYAAMGYGGTARSNANNESEALGIGGRVTWTPFMDKVSLLHLGLSLANEFDVDRLGEPTTGYEARLADSVKLVDLVPGTASTTLADIDDIMRFGVEAAYATGPFSVQTEYLTSKADSEVSGDQEVKGYYVMGSYFLTGETRPYKASTGTFDRVKPNDKSGAWEAALRYSTIEGESDLAGAATGEVDNITLGLNWYMNPQVRFMLNLIRSDVDTPAPLVVDPRVTGDINTLALRAQFDF